MINVNEMIRQMGDYTVCFSAIQAQVQSKSGLSLHLIIFLTLIAYIVIPLTSISMGSKCISAREPTVHTQEEKKYKE